MLGTRRLFETGRYFGNLWYLKQMKYKTVLFWGRLKKSGGGEGRGQKSIKKWDIFASAIICFPVKCNLRLRGLGLIPSDV